MRLAVFIDTETGRRFAMLPTNVSIMEERGVVPQEKITKVVESHGNSHPASIQGTFEEAVSEVNSALGETIFKMKGKLFKDAVPEDKTGKCVDCGVPVHAHQLRCSMCYRKEMDKPVDPVTVEEVADVVNQPLDAMPRVKYCGKCGDEIDVKIEWYWVDRDSGDIACEKCVHSDRASTRWRRSPRVEPTPGADSLSMTIIKDGGESEQVTFTDLDPCAVTAAEINAGLRKAGYDASMVHSMTPLHMLESAERRMASAEERCKKAQDREQAWADWFEEIRVKYDGVIYEMRAIEGEYVSEKLPWQTLEETHPWPSLEDERAQAIQDI